jgi:hypothetical protein
VSAHGRTLVLASGVQGGGGHPPAAHDTSVVLAVIALMAVICVGIGLYMHRSSRRVEPVSDQWRALAVMGELCPHGWQAQITLFGWNAPIPDDAPPARAPLVELEWKQFAEEPGRVAVARRVWAPTIERALQVMVDDRRTDLALEQIEQAAMRDGDLDWND